MPNFPLAKLRHKLKFKIKIAKMKWLLIYFNCQNSKINEIKKTCQISIHGLHGEPKRKKALFVVFLSYFIYSQIWLNHPTYDHHFDHSTKSTPIIKNTHSTSMPTMCRWWTNLNTGNANFSPYPIFLWILQEVPNKLNRPV
jgi:hypothetical protein